MAPGIMQGYEAERVLRTELPLEYQTFQQIQRTQTSSGTVKPFKFDYVNRQAVFDE